ncbi:hypothetical protein MHYP_G00026780 [Metynnis hypsauchen]
MMGFKIVLGLAVLATVILLTECSWGTGKGNSYNYDLSKMSDLTKLYNSKVYQADRMRRPLEGMSFQAGILSHSGVRVTLEDGTKWLVHKGDGYGISSQTVVVDARHMSTSWKIIETKNFRGSKKLHVEISSLPLLLSEQSYSLPQRDHQVRIKTQTQLFLNNMSDCTVKTEDTNLLQMDTEAAQAGSGARCKLECTDLMISEVFSLSSGPSLPVIVEAFPQNDVALTEMTCGNVKTENPDYQTSDDAECKWKYQVSVAGDTSSPAPELCEEPKQFCGCANKASQRRSADLRLDSSIVYNDLTLLREKDSEAKRTQHSGAFTCIGVVDPSNAKGAGREGPHQRGGGKGGGKRTSVSNEIRATLVNLVLVNGMSMREAGQKVQPNLSRFTVASIIRTFRQENRTDRRHHFGGRPRLLSEEQENAIVNMAIANNVIRLREIQNRIIEDQSVFQGIDQISIATIDRILQCNRTAMKQACRVPFERNSENIKDQRLEYVQRIMELEAKGIPHEFIFIDEVGFNLNKRKKRAEDPDIQSPKPSESLELYEVPSGQQKKKNALNIELAQGPTVP